jgi:hypothetical protein
MMIAVNVSRISTNVNKSGEVFGTFGLAPIPLRNIPIHEISISRNEKAAGRFYA